MSVLTVIRNTEHLSQEKRIETLEKQIAEMEKWVKSHLHTPSGAAY